MIVRIVHGLTGSPKPRIYNRIVKKELTVKLRFKLDAPNGAVAKIVGLTDFSALWHYQRVRKGGWDHLLDSGHETSDRIVAVWQRDRVLLRAYPYQNGSGPSTDKVSYTRNLCTVFASKEDPMWTDWVTITINTQLGMMEDVYNVYDANGNYIVDVDDADPWTMENLPNRTCLQWIEWSHARGGERDHAAAILTYEIEGL